MTEDEDSGIGTVGKAFGIGFGALLLYLLWKYGITSGGKKGNVTTEEKPAEVKKGVAYIDEDGNISLDGKVLTTDAIILLGYKEIEIKLKGSATYGKVTETKETLEKAGIKVIIPEEG